MSKEKLVTTVLNIITVVFILFILAMAFSGCNPARKIEKAEQLVITTPSSFNKVGYMYFTLYRQPIDTVIKYLPGKTDSIQVEVPTIDSIAVNNAIHALQSQYQRLCDSAVDASYRKGAADAVKELSKIRIPGRRVDTIVRPDIKCATILKLVDDSLTRANGHIRQLIGKTEQLEKDVITGVDERKMWIWLFIAACCVSVLTNIIWFKFKMKI